jgi:hypothetical protein
MRISINRQWGTDQVGQPEVFVCMLHKHKAHQSEKTNKETLTVDK